MDVVLCWHMHQPDYRVDGRYLKPWTWLHALKDYSDMAAHLESVPGARAVINFSPVLIEQLDDYPQRIRALLEGDEPAGDLLLDALAGIDAVDRRDLLTQLLRVNEDRIKIRFAPYARLFERATTEIEGGELMADQEIRDLLHWYVFAWLGESIRAEPLVEGFVIMESGFSTDDSRALLAFIAEVIDGLLPRYRKLAEAGTVEVSLTPYAHPILPLMLDFESARDAMPEAVLPDQSYPGGEARCHWHLGEARKRFQTTFGFEPAGCWPSEGALSQQTLHILGEHDFRWTASGSQVLHNTIRKEGVAATILPQLELWKPAGEGLPVCFFRDDGLSDLIGFEYSKWSAEDAVNDFITRLETLAEEKLRADGHSPVLSIIMDGENAWEYFPENGWAFLRTLYTRLADHPDLVLTTFTESMDCKEPRPLPRLYAGSWVHGSFSTWIGDPAKNRAWDLLGSAKRAVDDALATRGVDRQTGWEDAVMRQLGICEASDWFWWLGDSNQLQDGHAFDSMFRTQLEALYGLLGSAPPDELSHSVDSPQPNQSQERLDETGAMRRSGAPANLN